MKKAKWSFHWYKNYQFQWKPYFTKNKLLWKDKWNSPRCEHPPSFTIGWLWWRFYGELGDDHYWEQWLWLYEYCEGNLGLAKRDWGWIDSDTKETTWRSEYEA